MIFVAKNVYVFVPNLCMLSCYAKTHLWLINHDFWFSINIYSYFVHVFLRKFVKQDQ
jgi:hypothetical protein